MAPNTDIKKSIFVDAKPVTVWSYLTDKCRLGEWYHPAEQHLTDGAPYSLYRTDDAGERVGQIRGTVLEMQPFTKLVITFVIAPMGEHESTITWSLNAVDGRHKIYR